MSKHNNVNPGQYKVAGRERPGQDVLEPERAPGGNEQDQAAQERWDNKQKEQRDSNDD
ncbi:MAG: hypothetical protein JWL71_4888 [Acidobacteria bacterium]|nr:hypothetical protein [Acidobacteriota bacterium]